MNSLVIELVEMPVPEFSRRLIIEGPGGFDNPGVTNPGWG